MAVRASFENSNEAKSEEEGGRGELKSVLMVAVAFGYDVHLRLLWSGLAGFETLSGGCLCPPHERLLSGRTGRIRVSKLQIASKL